MSATFRLAKKQYSQNDLRRLMQEQKSKNKQTTSQIKVDSPLAKYNDAGQLNCVLCKSVVRSESVWKVHINTKVHKENVEAAKKLKEKLQIVSNKRQGEYHLENKDIPEKKIKIESISSRTETINDKTNLIPEDFFDVNDKKKYFEATLKKTSIKKELVNIKRENIVNQQKLSEEMKVINNEDVNRMDVDEILPEGFFDDPIKDAKVRNLEYRDPQEEEWERFQKEIKEESTVSNAIIAEEQEEATTERQIEEIDEQIRKWSRVLDLEKKKEDVCAKVKQKMNRIYKNSEVNESSDEDDDTTDIDELLDWRAKSIGKIQR